jgi:ABC-type glycerol-3-phosphate transport system permease component
VRDFVTPRALFCDCWHSYFYFILFYFILFYFILFYFIYFISAFREYQTASVHWLASNFQNTEFKRARNCLTDMNKTASHPLHFGPKICQKTLQALTDKNCNLFQELWAVFWLPKRKPKPMELYPLTVYWKKTTPCSACTNE